MTALDLLPRYARLDTIQLDPTSAQASDLADFKAHLPGAWGAYLKASAVVDLPPNLIAAIHWREAGGSFHAYLAQGDPLGRAPIHVPVNEPTEPDTILGWEDAAAFALRADAADQKALGLTALSSADLAAILAYCEAYNGTGYARKGVPSPYCLAGTSAYNGGKYVRDGVYDPSFHDQQIGVLPMLWAAAHV